MSVNTAKWTFFFVSLCFQNIFFALNFVQLPSWNRFKLLPFLVHCCFRIQIFRRLRRQNELVHQVVMSFSCNVIFMVFGLRRFWSLSRGLLTLHDTCMLCFWNLIGFATLRFSFLKAGALLCSFLARHCRIQLSPRVLDGFLKFRL